jgi:hypothetical protein
MKSGQVCDLISVKNKTPVIITGVLKIINNQ